MQLRGIDTNLIVALQALLVHRNVTRAGREIGLSQPSMSHALSRLRAHFGDPLLVPFGRELVLTDRAKGLVEPVADAVARLERVFEKSEAFDPMTSKRVFRIAATDNLELYVLPKLSALLESAAPHIDIRVSALRHDWVTSLERGEIDLKLGRKSSLPETLESQDLSKENFSCAVRAKHGVRNKPTLREYAGLAHLVVTPTAAPDRTPSTIVDEILAKRGLERRVHMTVPHFAVAPFIVASSDLALTAPTRLLDPFIKLLRLRRLELPIKVPGYHLSQVWARRSGEDAGHRWLLANVARLFA